MTEELYKERAQSIIDGAPITRAWVEKTGADGYSEVAVGAVGIAKELLGKADQ